MSKVIKYVGLDVHKDSISVAVAGGEGEEVRYVGEVANTTSALKQVVSRLSRGGQRLSFCYEAGGCGYTIYRELTQWGHGCVVVAPSLIPRKPGERIKTDRRDAMKLARLHRAGELTGVWVPDEEQEAIRDLCRARMDGKHVQRQARQRLNAYLLRHAKRFSGRTRWGRAHSRWLETVRFDNATQQLVFQEYIDAVTESDTRLACLEAHMHEMSAQWVMAPVVEGLMALRGVSLVTALTVVAELGDITRFDNARQLMAYLGLVPSEHSSGSRIGRGGLTKTGNSLVRRLLVESAWSYRFNARKTTTVQRRAQKTTAPVQAIAWKAQTRLCGRYRALSQRGKKSVQVCAAVARELVGFIWAIAHHIMGTQRVAG